MGARSYVDYNDPLTYEVDPGKNIFGKDLDTGQPIYINGFEDWRNFFAKYGNDERYANLINYLCESYPQVASEFSKWKVANDAMNKAQESGDWNGALLDIGNSGVEIDPSLLAYINNQVSRENTQAAYSQEEHMRDTSLTSAGSQLANLGLSVSNVTQTGGASASPAPVAATSAINSASLKQQRAMNTYNQKMALARGVISMAGSLASSGIYGAALGASRSAAAKLSSAAAHSGLLALKTSSGKSYADVINGMQSKW